MEQFKKVYTVRNCLATYQIWDRHQTSGWKRRFGRGTPSSLFDVTGGVANIYYTDSVFRTFKDVASDKLAKSRDFFAQEMASYQVVLADIQGAIALNQPLTSVAAIQSFAASFEAAWIGLDLSYMPDSLQMDDEAEQLSAEAREAALGFYVGADRMLRMSISALYPDVSEFAEFLTLEEITSGKLSPRANLELRSRHYILYEEEIFTGVSLGELCKKKSLELAASDNVLAGRDLEPRDLNEIADARIVSLDVGGYHRFSSIAARALGKHIQYNKKPLKTE